MSAVGGTLFFPHPCGYQTRIWRVYQFRHDRCVDKVKFFGLSTTSPGPCKITFRSKKFPRGAFPPGRGRQDSTDSANPSTICDFRSHVVAAGVMDVEVCPKAVATA